MGKRIYLEWPSKTDVAPQCNSRLQRNQGSFLRQVNWKLTILKAKVRSFCKRWQKFLQKAVGSGCAVPKCIWETAKLLVTLCAPGKLQNVTAHNIGAGLPPLTDHKHRQLWSKPFVSASTQQCLRLTGSCEATHVRTYRSPKPNIEESRRRLINIIGFVESAINFF